MHVLRESEVDGVPCFWVETGRPTLAARLMFRHGVVDETFTDAGWLHLLEHSALHGRDGGTLQVNGSTSLMHVTFDLHGEPDAVATTLGEVSRWLSDPDLHDLERERKVLRAEGRTRGGGSVLQAVGWRYGAAGPGLAAYLEPGLGRATAERLRSRAAEVFTRGNGVLVLDGPPPPGLALQLPEGPLTRPPVAVPCEDVLPAAYVDEAGLTLSGVVGRSVESTVVPELLQRALHHRLRSRDGASYAPWATYEAVDVEHALVVAGSDVAPQSLPTLADDILRFIDQVVRAGPHPDHLAEVVAQRRMAIQDPYAGVGLAVRAAHSHLEGRPAQSMDEVLAELGSMDPGLIRSALEDFHATLALGIPGRTTWKDQLPMPAFPTGEPQVRGRRFRHVDWPAEKARIVVGAGGVELQSGRQARLVRFGATGGPGDGRDEVVGLATFPDGGRSVVRRDGYSIDLDPRAWRRAPELAAALDQVVPDDLHVPFPERELAPLARLSPWRRWLGGLVTRPAAPSGSGWRTTAALFVLCVVLWFVGVVGTVVSGRTPPLSLFTSGLLAGGLGVLALRQRRRATTRDG